MTSAETAGRVPFDVHNLLEPYMQLSSGVIQFVRFEYQIAGLVWLHRATTAAIDAEVENLAAIRGSGAHLVPGYDAESDDNLDDSLDLLDQDVAPISAGTILMACCGALESLLTDLLPTSDRIEVRGLSRKVQALMALWPQRATVEHVLENTRWLTQRRNSFAHRLLDEGGPWETNPDAPRFVFGEDMVEESFERVGEIAEILDVGYGRYSTRRTTSAQTARADE
ncbi:hypothetical protein ACFVWG_20600 [Kribbella sp. NPDC058245]|uniref:hypothetical protein n=1 Tax=Kribbella sp. NPDC058245 TaxID=3346399 RepID=UPI0036E94F24